MTGSFALSILFHEEPFTTEALVHTKLQISVFVNIDQTENNYSACI